MSRLIDADVLERDVWQMSRTVQIDKNTMEFQTRKPTDFPAIEPQRMRGRWIEPTEDNDYWECPVCHDTYELDVDVTPKDARLFFCPNCGADMRKEQEC